MIPGFSHANFPHQFDKQPFENYIAHPFSIS